MTRRPHVADPGRAATRGRSDEFARTARPPGPGWIGLRPHTRAVVTIGVLAATVTACASGQPAAQAEAHDDRGISAPSPNVSRTWSPDGTRLVFFLPWDGEAAEREIFVADFSEQRITRLTDNGSEDANPAWSPDGTRIAFFSNRAGGALQIYTMNPEGGEPTQLTHADHHSFSPSWSPDGMRIAYETYIDGNRDIWTMQADGSDAVRATVGPEEEGRPAWSPDGRRLLF